MSVEWNEPQQQKEVDRLLSYRQAADKACSRLKQQVGSSRCTWRLATAFSTIVLHPPLPKPTCPRKQAKLSKHTLPCLHQAAAGLCFQSSFFFSSSALKVIILYVVSLCVPCSLRGSKSYTFRINLFQKYTWGGRTKRWLNNRLVMNTGCPNSSLTDLFPLCPETPNRKKSWPLLWETINEC